MNADLPARTWVVEGALLACTYPESDEDWQALQALGIRHLVCLHERAHPPETLARWGMRQTHIPTPDFTPPQPAQLSAGVETIRETIAMGTPLAVHCRAGLGRTGTLVAAWFTTQGLTPDEAITRIRVLRPGSVETAEQEQAVAAFARDLA